MTLNSEFTIRLARPGDEPSILSLDKKVSFEFFAPLYAAYYSKWEFGKNPEFYLSKELELDEEIFPQIIRRQYLEDYSLEYRIFGAFDSKNICRGVLLVEIIKDLIEIKLLYIDDSLRRIGLGRMLLNAMFSYFEKYRSFLVYALQFGNDRTLSFYTAMGFKNLGPGPANKLNIYNVPYSEIYYKFMLQNNK